MSIDTDLYDRIIKRSFNEITLLANEIEEHSISINKKYKKIIIKKDKKIECKKLTLQSITKCEDKTDDNCSDLSRAKKLKSTKKRFDYGMRFYVVDTSSSEDSD